MFAEFIRFYLVWFLITIIFFSPILLYLIVKCLSENYCFYDYEDTMKYDKIVQNTQKAEMSSDDITYTNWYRRQVRKEKLVDDIYYFFDLSKVWQFILLVVDILAITVFATGMIIGPYIYYNSKKTIENNHRVVIEYESNLKPTKIICDKAEEYNEDLKDLDFTSSVEDQKEYIDTELLWARFLNNTNARAESIIKE